MGIINPITYERDGTSHEKELNKILMNPSWTDLLSTDIPAGIDTIILSLSVVES